MQARAVWRARLWTWLPAVLFFAANLGLLSAYRLVYAERAAALAKELETRSRELSELQEKRRGREELVQGAETTRLQIRDFYSQRLATEGERLTRVISEVKSLARRAGLEPQVINYPEELFEEHGLVKRSLAFTVDGTYLQLRQLVNLLELSDLFLTLEEVGLRETAGSEAHLRMTLTIASMFSLDAPAPSPRRTS